MTWARLDDSMLTHHKVAALSPSAGWLWVRGLVYANKHLTDGVLHAGAVKVLGAKKRDADELVRAGLWEEGVDNAFRIHDFADWNETRADVESRRDAWRRRQSVARSVTRDSREPVTRDNGVITQSVTRESLSPIPSHPISDADASDARASSPVSELRPQASAETQIAELLRSHRALADSQLDVVELAQTCAFAGDSRKPAHVLAALRRGLDEAAPQHLTDAKLVKLLRGYASRASERDLLAAPESQSPPQPGTSSSASGEAESAGPMYKHAEAPPTAAELAEFAAAREKATDAIAAIRRAGGNAQSVKKVGSDD